MSVFLLVCLSNNYFDMSIGFQLRNNCAHILCVQCLYSMHVMVWRHLTCHFTLYRLCFTRNYEYIQNCPIQILENDVSHRKMAVPIYVKTRKKWIKAIKELVLHSIDVNIVIIFNGRHVYNNNYYNRCSLHLFSTSLHIFKIRSGRR